MSDEGFTPKHRSSPFPFIDLEKALERAKEFYQQQRHHPAPVHVAVALWGYGTKSSGGSQTIAALKLYGLMADEGSGTERRVILTETALRVLRDTRDPSPERINLIKRLAITPKIFQELYEKYGTELPNLATVAYYLEVERGGFTDQSARALISVYRETIVFAGLEQPGTVGTVEPDGTEDMAANSQRDQFDSALSVPSKPVSLPLGSGERAVFSHEVEPQHGLRVIVQGDVDEEILDALEVYVTLQRKRLERRALSH